MRTTDSLFKAKPVGFSSAVKHLSHGQLRKNNNTYIHNQKENFSQTVNELGLINQLKKETLDRLKITEEKISQLRKKQILMNNKLDSEIKNLTNSGLGLEKILNTMNQNVRNGINTNKGTVDLQSFVQKHIVNKTDSQRQQELKDVLHMVGLAQSLHNVEMKSEMGFLDAAKKIKNIANKKNVSQKELYSNSVLRMGVLLEPVMAALLQETTKDIFKEFKDISVSTQTVGTDRKLKDINQTIRAKGEVNLGTDVKLSENYTNIRSYNLFSSETDSEVYNYIMANMLVTNTIWGRTNYGQLNTSLNRFLNATFLYYNLIDAVKNTTEEDDDTVFLATPKGVILKSAFTSSVISSIKKIQSNGNGTFKSFGTIQQDFSKVDIGMTRKNLWNLHDRKYRVARGKDMSSGYDAIIEDSRVSSSFSSIFNRLNKLKFNFRLSLKIPRK